MADTRGFFEDYLPRKLEDDPGLAASVGAVFQFRIEGAGDWVLDLRTEGGEVREGRAESPDCTITTTREVWEKILDNPNKAITMAMMGKLKIDNLGLAMSLQKILA